MGYAKNIYSSAAAILQKRRNDAAISAQERKREVCEKHADYLSLTKRISALGMSAAKAAFSNGGKEKIAQLAKESLNLQQEAKTLLKKYGYPEDYTTIKHECPICEDTGFVGEKVCECQKKLLIDLAKKELSRTAPVKDCTFANFSTSYYTNVKDENGCDILEHMEDVLRFCKYYCGDFAKNSPSLFMYGKTGLGKTHLSLAIANGVIEQGYGVIYGSAKNLIAGLENEHFGRRNDFYSENALLTCDLLIIDDLGAEFTNAFAVSEVYNIINTRLLAKKPTIISTNLDIKGIEKLYTERIASRIVGEYQAVKFYGEDIRVRKNFEY